MKDQHNNPAILHQHPAQLKLSYAMGILSDVDRLCRTICDTSDIPAHADEVRTILLGIANQMSDAHAKLDDVCVHMDSIESSVSTMCKQIEAFAKLHCEPLSHQITLTYGDWIVAMLLAPDADAFITSLAWDILDDDASVSLPPYYGSMSMRFQAFLLFRERPIYSRLPKTFGDLMVQMSELGASHRHEALNQWADDVLGILHQSKP